MSNIKSKQKEIYLDGLLPYLLYKPEHIKAPYPVLFFLHGYGERGSNLDLLKLTGLPQLLEKQDLDFMVISPQCPIDPSIDVDNRESGWWATEDKQLALDELFEYSLARYEIDQTRIYMTGLSMGGYGTWEFATRNPTRLAAIAPICGGGTPQKAASITQLPTWAFHGANDDVVPVGESMDMIQAIRDLGGEPELTVYLNTKHDSWTRTYQNDELYKWFLKYKID